MHSDYLNEDKICEMFQQEHDTGPKKQQISLNFTVTSRQSRCIPAPDTSSNKAFSQLDRNSHNGQMHGSYFQSVPNEQNNNAQSNINIMLNGLQNNCNNNSNISGSIGSGYFSKTMTISTALSQLEKFQGWMTIFNKNSQKLIDDVEQLEAFVDASTIALSMPDLENIKRKCSRGNNLYINNNYGVHGCPACLKAQQTLQIVQEQHNLKLHECQSLRTLSLELQHQLQEQINNGVRDRLLMGVELQMMKTQNKKIMLQLSQCHGQVQQLKSQLQTSRIQLQKARQMGRTRQILDHKLQTLNPVSISNTTSNAASISININTSTNSKLFSNAKYSNANTMTMNPNDTMNTNNMVNRVDSVICFGDSEPNLEELVRFYHDEFEAVRGRIVGEESRKRDRKAGHNNSNNSKDCIRDQFGVFKNQYKLMELYKIIASKLSQLKILKQRQIGLGQQPSDESLHISYLQSSPSPSSCMSHTPNLQLQTQVKILQNQYNNLKETNADLLIQLKAANARYKEVEEKLWKIHQEYKLYREVVEKKKNRDQQSVRMDNNQNKMNGCVGAIKVFCRIRPRIGVQLKYKNSVTCPSEQKIVHNAKQFQFDKIFVQKSSQKELLNQIKPMINMAYEGKSLCIFSYGQTGSGKTYTIHGNQHHPGLAFNIIDQLYELIQSDTKNSTSILMSIVQIYKQQIRDLTGVSGTGKIQIRENQQKGLVYLQDCKPIRVKTKQQLLQIYHQGIMNRSCGQTEMNNDSSRSHCIFTLHIQRSIKRSRQSDHKLPPKLSKISLVDLAGSQKLTSSNPLIAKQAQFINKSLSTLGAVLFAIKNKQQPVPYRESKLTYLLKQFLTPKNNVVGLVHISPSQLHSLETANTLNFGAKIKIICSTSHNIVNNTACGNENKSYYSRSKEGKDWKDIRDIKEIRNIRESRQGKQFKELKDNKENQKNRRSSARLSIG